MRGQSGKSVKPELEHHVFFTGRVFFFGLIIFLAASVVYVVGESLWQENNQKTHSKSRRPELREPGGLIADEISSESGPFRLAKRALNYLNQPKPTQKG